MSPDRKRIYDFVEKNPNVTVNQVIDAIGLSRSLCYKFLVTEHFIANKVRNRMGGIVMIFSINDNKVIANQNIPIHHELHRAFWGVAC